MVIWVDCLISNPRINFQVGERRIDIYIYLLTSDVESPIIIIIPTTDPPQKSSTNHDRGHGKMQTHSTILLGPRTQK